MIAMSTKEGAPAHAFPGDVEVPPVLRNGTSITIRINHANLAEHPRGLVRMNVYPTISPVHERHHLGFWDAAAEYFRTSDTVIWTAEGLLTDRGERVPGRVYGNLRESASVMLHVSFLETADAPVNVAATRSIQAFYLYDDALPQLRDVWMPITGRCNLACVMCGRTKRDEIPLMKTFFRNADVSAAIVAAVEAQAETLQSVGFLGFGEPFLSDRVFEIVAQLRARLPEYARLGLTSNGTVLDDETCARILDSGLEFLTFSIDGASKATYEKIRVHGDFDRVIANIRRLSDLKRHLSANKPLLKACFVIMHDNYHEIVDFVGLAATLGIEEVIFWLENETGPTLPKAEVTALLERAERAGHDASIAINRHACVFPEFTPEVGVHRQCLQDYHQRVEGLLRARGEFCPEGANALDYIDDNSGLGNGGRTDVYCPYMETLLIEHSGDVNPCCSYWNEYTLGLPQRFGNASKQSLAAIWGSRTYESFRRRVIEQDWPVICQNCNARLPRSK